MLVTIKTNKVLTPTSATVEKPTPEQVQWLLSSWSSPEQRLPMFYYIMSSSTKERSCSHIFFYFLFLFFGFLRQGFSVVLESVLELALVGQAGFKLRDPPASASQVLELKGCATITQRCSQFLRNSRYYPQGHPTTSTRTAVKAHRRGALHHSSNDWVRSPRGKRLGLYWYQDMIKIQWQNMCMHMYVWDSHTV